MIASQPGGSSNQGATRTQQALEDVGTSGAGLQAAPPLQAAAARQLQLPPLSLSGRPPLPRNAPASSATSSRASSPRSAVSAQPSLQTLSMNRLAQYQPAARTFKPNAQSRRGLTTGDVVAFRSQGQLLAVAELSISPQEASTVHFGLQPAAAGQAELGNHPAAHLEVIRQGKWVGFRSAAAGDRFLQARKRSPNRLVFFSHNVGTWEQWELGGGADPEASDWSSLQLTLRHRRLPQFELAVELVRVGAYSPPPHSNAAITPRTLLPASEAMGAGAGGPPVDEGPGMERRELKRMSGVLVHEWLHYVDQEKAARLAVEARMAQLAEDAAGLRDWAVMQVDSVRREMGEEVDALLEAVQAKSALLADTESRLTSRLRWGVAMIQAKSELASKRQAFMWWRWIAARKHYCRHVEAKLQQRADLRVVGRALQAWAEHTERQRAVQARLRAAVRRMYLVRLYHTFTAWQDMVALKRQQQEERQALVEAACLHMQRWRQRRLLCAWQAHAAACCAGRQLLQRMAVRAERGAQAAAFCAWHTHVSLQRDRLAAFSAAAAARQRQRAQQAAFHGWRLQADDEHGSRLQLWHAQQVLARGCQRAVLHAWLECKRQRAGRRERWEATIAYMRQRGAAIQVDAAFAAWQELVGQQRERRAAFYSAVQHLALHKMSVAFRGWQCLVAWRQHARKQVQGAVVRLSERSMAQALAAWRQCVAEQRVARHRVAVCQRRQQTGTLRGVLRVWRQVAAVRAAERQAVQLCQKRANRIRLALALAALRANASAAAQRREQAKLAVEWYAESLQARALAGLAQAVSRRRSFEQRLKSVAQSVQLEAVRQAFASWRVAAAVSISARQLVVCTQRRFKRSRLQRRFSAWQAALEQRRQQEGQLQRHCVKQASRMLRAAFSCWQQHASDLGVARQVAAQRAAAGAATLLRDCLVSWGAHASQQVQQRAATAQLAQRQADGLARKAVDTWTAFVGRRRQQRAQLQRATRKLAAVCQRHAFAAWRQQATWQRGEVVRLAVLERRLASRHAARSQAAAFRSWRAHAGSLAAARAAVEAKAAAEGGVVVRHALAAWRGHTQAQAVRHDHILRVCVARQCCMLQSKALVTWQLFAQRQAHNREAVEVTVHRMARRLSHAALLTWRQAAQERRVRRTAIARFIQRWDAARSAAALSHWRQLLAERCQAQEDLKRCLIRKRVAFRLYRQWYWESFDDDMQETLRTMFEITEEAALDPLPSRAGSPYGSLLSSPIRQLYGMPRQQQLQLNAGVAEALGRPGTQLHPSAAAQHKDGGGYGGGFGLPQLPPREPLASRLAAAAAAQSSAHSSASAPPAANLGGAALAPLREYGAFTMHGNAMLEPVLEVAESPYARSPAYAAYGHVPRGSPNTSAMSATPRSGGGGGASASVASSAASTALPGSPLTPASAFAAGDGSPLTGVSRLATPPTGGAQRHLQQQHHHHQLSDSPLSAAHTPGAGGLSALSPMAAAALQRGSPWGDMSQAATPPYSQSSALRSPGLSLAGTPQPDFAAGYSSGAFQASPSAAAALEQASIPLGMQGRYQMRRFGDAAAADSGAASAAPGSPYGTPLAAHRTPPPGLPELLAGDYSMRRFGEEGWKLAGEATPPHPSSASGGFISAYPAGGVPYGGTEAVSSASKTPLLHLNPLAM